MAEHNNTVPDHSRIQFRIGINVGDIVVEDGDLFGDGVNVVARLEALAEPGICVSARVQEDTAGKLDLAFELWPATLRATAGRPASPLPACAFFMTSSGPQLPCSSPILLVT
jgi:class 3 adenylate cyclase